MIIIYARNKVECLMPASRSKRWWMYRLADVGGTLIGSLFITIYFSILYSSQLDTYRDVLDDFVESFLVLFSIWYVVTLYFLVILIMRLNYIGRQIPTLKLRFIAEIGVFVTHSFIVMTLFAVYDGKIIIFSSGFF
jgi:hypothetical protein